MPEVSDRLNEVRANSPPRGTIMRSKSLGAIGQEVVQPDSGEPPAEKHRRRKLVAAKYPLIPNPRGGSDKIDTFTGLVNHNKMMLKITGRTFERGPGRYGPNTF